MVCSRDIGEKIWLEDGGSSLSSWENIVSEVITGNFFGADRIDYLLRDSKSTGVAYGLFDYHQLIEMIRILPYPDKEKELSLGINENGIESCEALLLARHFMHKRVYQYAGVKSFSFHLKKFMELCILQQDLENISSYLSLTDNTILHKLQMAYSDENHPAHAHAAAILARKNRYKALATIPDLSKDILQVICEKTAIDSFHLEKALPKKHESL